MHLSRLIAGPIAAGLLAVAAAPAYAAGPIPNGVYRGPSTDHDTVSIRVDSHGSEVSATVKDACGHTTRLSNGGRVGDDGSFRLVRKNKAGATVMVVNGTFVTHQKAKGHLRSKGCHGNLRSYTAKYVS